jgi:SAM-dependent methyltransferase
MAYCYACGGADFADRAILWDDLVAAWELSDSERRYVDRQQGTHCLDCGSSLRSIVLAKAITDTFSDASFLVKATESSTAARLRFLEINEAGSLTQFLSKLPQHTLGVYPTIDMQRLPYENCMFDIVVHSDTLEHVQNPDLALRETARVLQSDGAMCFTVPIIVDRQSRTTLGRPPSFHGFPGGGQDDLRVHTEFGADVWTACMRAGFQSVTFTTVEYPAAIAITAWKTKPRRFDLESINEVVAADVHSTSWRMPRLLRYFGRAVRGLRP